MCLISVNEIDNASLSLIDDILHKFYIFINLFIFDFDTHVMRAHLECLATPNRSTTQNTSKMLNITIVTGHLKNKISHIVYHLKADS